MDDATLTEAVDYIAIRRLQSAYADIVTRRAWTELEGVFLPDAVVEVDKRDGAPLVLRGPRAVGDFIGEAISDFEFFEFVVLNTRIEIGVDGDPDAAVVWMYMCELRQDRSSGRFTVAYGVYHDRMRRAGGWWFEHRLYHSLARTGRDADVFEFPPHLSTRSPGALQD